MKSDIDLLNSTEKDLKWFQKNSKQIREKYANKIIAIENQNIIAIAPNFKELSQILKGKNIDESEVLIKTISPPGEITIFSK